MGASFITDIETAEKVLNDTKRKILVVSTYPYHGDKNIFQVINLASRLDKEVVFMSVDNISQLYDYKRQRQRYIKKFEERAKRNFCRCDKLCKSFGVNVYYLVVHDNLDKILSRICKAVKLIDMIVLEPDIDVYSITSKLPVHLYSIHVLSDIDIQGYEVDSCRENIKNKKEEDRGGAMFLKLKSKRKKKKEVEEKHLNKPTAQQSCEENKILVVSKDSSFTQAIIEYAVHMASKLNAKIVALNLDEKSQNFEAFKKQAREAALVFQAKAGERGVGFSHLVAEGEESAVIRQLHAKDKAMKYIIDDSPTYIEKGQHFPVYCRLQV